MKYTDEFFKKIALENTKWIKDFLEEYDSKKEKIKVKCNNNHIFLAECKALTRKDKLKQCPICRKERFNSKKYCKFCGKELLKKENIFCSNSCAAKYNNPRRSTKKYCKFCGKELLKGQIKFCSNRCQMDYQYDEKIKKWKNNPSNINKETSISYIKKYFRNKYGNKCQLCGWSEKNQLTGIIPLELHHINGISSDNREENLQLLCPNCHSLTSTYKSLNKGFGREKRY